MNEEMATQLLCHLTSNACTYVSLKNACYYNNNNNNCRVITCTEPLLSNGKYLAEHNGPIYQYEEFIYAVCESGYTLVGPITRECQFNTEWSDEDPSCELGIAVRNYTMQV